jgi:hypothetical protein
MPNLPLLSNAYGIPKAPLTSYNTTGIKLFPTKHPFVKNKDGSVSNVVLSGEDIVDGKGGYLYTIAFPTMVEGKQLTKEEAFKVAQQQGIDKYPKFTSPQEMNSWAEKYHGSIDEKGVLIKNEKPTSSQSIMSAMGMKRK